MPAIQPIQVSPYLSSVKRQIAEAANTVQSIQTSLQTILDSAKGTMGDSTDLVIFEQKYIKITIAIAELSADLSEYANRLGIIQNNYRTAQEEAIQRAKAIPK